MRQQHTPDSRENAELYEIKTLKQKSNDYDWWFQKRKFSKSQRKIKPIADKIISSYGKANPNLYNFVAEELVNEDIYKKFDQALNDCKIVLDEIDAGSQLALEIENIQSEKKRINER